MYRPVNVRDMLYFRIVLLGVQMNLFSGSRSMIIYFFFAIFTKGNNLYGFWFVHLGDELLRKRDLLKEEFVSREQVLSFKS